MRTQDILDHLEKFVAIQAIAKAGSLKQASSVLGISQPSLTIKINKLEDVLGYKLFHRSRQGVVLTEQGQRVLEFVKSVQSSAEDLKNQLDVGAGLVSGHVKIGIYDSIARYFWPKFYKYFQNKFPDISISLTTGRSHDLIDLLHRSKVDIAFTVEPTVDREVVVDILFSDHFAFYCSPAFLKSRNVKGRNFPLLNADKQPIPLILFSQALGSHGNLLDRKIHIHRAGDFQVHQVESFEIAQAFALEDIGVTVLPNQAAKNQLEKGKLVKCRIDSEIPMDFGLHDIGLSTLKKRYYKPSVQTVLKSIQEYI